MPPSTVPEESTRHWSFTAFEWIVRDVHKLRKFVEVNESSDAEEENSHTVGQDDFEVLKESPILGEGKFKLEIGTW